MQIPAQDIVSAIEAFYPLCVNKTITDEPLAISIDAVPQYLVLANDLKFANVSALLLRPPKQVQDVERFHNEWCLRLLSGLKGR